MDTKHTGEPRQANRRYRPRMALRLPVRVKGRERDGSVFEEQASCLDASEGGVSITLRHPVRQGQLLHLSLPLPSRFRQYDLTDYSYRVYGLVRYVGDTVQEGARVGFMFYGRNPPPGPGGALPAGLFLLPGDAGATSQKRPRVDAALTIRLAADDGPGAPEHGESVAAERVGARDARVRVFSLPVTSGSIVLVEGDDGRFRTRARVRYVLTGPDGSRRVEIEFLDGSAPEHLQTEN